MEQAEVSSEQATCSREQTGASEQAGSAVEPMECSEPIGQTGELPCMSDQREGSYEQVVLSSGSEERSPEPTICEKPAQDELEFTEPWLNRFVEQLGRVPSLWRPQMHSGVIKEKTARGFGYMRLMSGLEPGAEGDKLTRITRGQALCKRFFSGLKKELRKAAASALESNSLASPDGALRNCPIWVRRADSFLNQMPLMVAQLNAQREGKSNKKKQPPAPPVPGVPGVAGAGTGPPRLQVPVPPGAAGAAWVRRVVRGVRRASRRHGAATRDAIHDVATRLGATDDRIYQTWWGVRKLAMYKLRQSILRGDVPTANGRLDAVDWAIVDLVLLYRANEMMIDESLYQNYEQLSALLGTFHLVQRFQLERHKQPVPVEKWVNAARWYSRNRVQMSAVALQKRWFELKLDTRRRFYAQMGGQAGLVPLPIHQAIARRYGYVVTRSAQQNWRHLVTSGQVAPPTSERGPAPGEDAPPRNIGDDDSSDTDTVRAEDDDDIAIVEKTLEIIDLSEDIREEDKTKEVVPTKEKAAISSKTEGHGHETGDKDEIMIVDSNVPVNTSDKPTVRSQKRKSSKHGNKPDKNHPRSKNKKISKQIDKTIDKTKEIVDLDAPSPDVLEALQELDVNNFETTIIFDSDDEDVRPNVDKKSEIPNDLNKDSVPSTNDNECQTKKAEKRHQRESSDSSNGNLVIDDNVNSENEGSDSGAEDITLRRSKSANENTLSENTQEAKDSKNAEEASNHPLLPGMLSSECIFDGDQDNATNIKYNIYDKTRLHEYNPNVYSNKKRSVKSSIVTVSDPTKEVTGETNDVEENEEPSSDDGSRSSHSSGGKERELGEEEGSIDPKLLMYAIVLLERIDVCLPRPTSRASSKSPSPTRPRSSSPESVLIKTERILSPSRSPIRDTSSPVPERASTPLLSRLTPSPSLDPPPLLSRITPSSPLDPPPLLSRITTPPPLRPSPLFTRTSPPPLSLLKPDPHPDSLFHFFATTLPPEFVFNKNNMPLLRMCKLCSVVLQTIDLTDKGKMGNRVAKKVELPDIEEVRRNNRSMLTAQVAPRRARRTSGPTPSPSSGSDSDWTPDASDSSAVRRTQRRTAESESDSRTQRRNTDDSGSDSRTQRRNTDDSGSDSRIRRRNTDESSSDPRETQRRDTESDSDEDLQRESERRTVDGSEFGVWKARRRVKEAELQRMLNNLAGIDGEKDCGHIKSTSMRGPAAAVLSSNCARCAARVLSAPPISGHEARLQRQLLRRAARMARTPTVFPPATTSTATTSAAAAPTTTTAAVTTATPTIVMTKAPEIIHRAKKSKKRARSPSLPLPLPLPHPARPRTPPSPVDPEAAAREWLRQKNIAAEKFGVKPRSYKKVAPAVQDSAPATIQPITEASSDTVQKPPQNSNQITILLTSNMSGATVVPLTEENLAKHTGQVFRTAPSSTTPTLFNPSAVADINKKLGALAPAKSLDFVPIKPANTDKLQNAKANAEFRRVITTTRINDDFRPVITNVQSLASLPKTHVKIVPADMPDLNNPDMFAVVNKKDPNVSKNIIIIPSSRNQPKKQEEAKTKENTENLPQVVNVSGGIHLPPSSVGQGLHLVVSQSSQKNTILNFQPSVSQRHYIPNVVVSGSAIQGLEARPKSTNNSRPFLVTSMPQRPPLILNSVLAGQSSQQHMSLLNSTQVCRVPRSSTVVTTSQHNVLFTSMPGHTIHSTPMVVRSVQAGSTGAPRPARTQPPWAHAQPPNPPPAQPPNPPPAQPPNPPPPQPPNPPPQPSNPPPTQPPNPPPAQPPNPPPQPSNPPPTQPPNPPPPQPPNPPLAQPPNPLLTQPPANLTEPFPSVCPTSEGEDTSDDIIMSSRLEFFRPPLASSTWCGGRDSTSLVVLCTGAVEESVWYIETDARQYLLVCEEEKPPAEAEYWALSPRVRLALPGNEGANGSDGAPAAKRARPAAPAPAPAPEPAPAPGAGAGAAPAVKTGYLKVKAFARMIPDPEKARKEAARPRTDDKPEKLLAPARMFVSNIIYQKLSDDPLVYAKVLVAVASSKACRALLTRGAPLQVYCLETGKLYPLEAEAKNDVSRITLTGDEEVSGVLIALATRLYHPYQGQETEQVSDRDREQDGERILEVRDAAEHMIDACETNQQAGPAIQQPSNPSSQQDQTSNDGTSANTAHTVLLNILSNKTIQIQPCPGSTVTTVTTVTTVAPPPPLTTPRPGSGPGLGEVIELSDED